FRHGEAFKLDSCLNIDVAPLSQLIDELETLINESIFNGRLADFKTISSEILLRDWLQQNNALSANLLNFLYNRGWAGAGQNHIACLPELDTEALESELQRQDLTGFSRAPHWQGRCFETTVLNRQLTQPLIADLSGRYGNGLIVRILARLLEVALIPSQLKQFLAQIKDKTILPAINPVKSQIGLAQVQAARGLLIHRLELQRGRVSDYRTVAPTEWNFHPDGVIVQSLKQLQAGNPSDLKRQAELLINAIDPCVQYALNLINSCNEI
ncbi:MAG: nickel-dependent hydrogenase large subunit, partial [Methylobacter sp.]